MAGNIQILTDENFSKTIGTGTVLVEFYADWCGPCRSLSPILSAVAGEMQGKATIAKVDIDASQKTAAHYQINSVPTMIRFKNGVESGRLVGLRNAKEVKDFILG